jgi:hypothetical protein
MQKPSLICGKIITNLGDQDSINNKWYAYLLILHPKLHIIVLEGEKIA